MATISYPFNFIQFLLDQDFEFLLLNTSITRKIKFHSKNEVFIKERPIPFRVDKVLHSDRKKTIATSEWHLSWGNHSM